jgi:hypothetical protein
VALDDDAELERFIANLLNHVVVSEMVCYWRDFVTLLDALVPNVHAVHNSIYRDYFSSLHIMLLWLVAFYNNRYGRWLSDF